MIHSLSGGVLADNGPILFAKVETAEGPRWFLAPFAVKAGEHVLVPVGETYAEGEVLRTELCTRQTAPIPVARARELRKMEQKG